MTISPSHSRTLFLLLSPFTAVAIIYTMAAALIAMGFSIISVIGALESGAVDVLAGILHVSVLSFAAALCWLIGLYRLVPALISFGWFGRAGVIDARPYAGRGFVWCLAALVLAVIAAIAYATNIVELGAIATAPAALPFYLAIFAILHLWLEMRRDMTPVPDDGEIG